MAYATNGGPESGLYKTIAALGKAVGLGVSIMATPAVFNHTKVSILTYLSHTWGGEIAYYLTWVMGGVEAYVIYVVTSLVFTAGIVAMIAAAAARRYGD
jgi:hypothetical protein